MKNDIRIGDIHPGTAHHIPERPNSNLMLLALVVFGMSTLLGLVAFFTALVAIAK